MLLLIALIIFLQVQATEKIHQAYLSFLEE